MSTGYLGEFEFCKEQSKDANFSKETAPTVIDLKDNNCFIGNANEILFSSQNHVQMTEKLLKLVLQYTNGDELFFIRKNFTKQVVDGIVTKTSCKIFQGIKLSKLNLFSNNILLEAKCEEAAIHLSTKEQIISVGSDYYTAENISNTPSSIICVPVFLSRRFCGAIYITNAKEENGFNENIDILQISLMITSLLSIINQHLLQDFLVKTNMNTKEDPLMASHIPANRIENPIIKDTHFVYNNNVEEWENEYIVLTKENLKVFSSPHDTNSNITIPISSIEDVKIFSSKKTHSIQNTLKTEIPPKLFKKMKAMIYIKSEGNSFTYIAIFSIKVARIWYDEIKNLLFQEHQSTGITNDDIPENIRIKANDIYMDEIIGCGGAATVYVGEWHQQKVAIKKLHEFMDPLNLNDFFSELSILHSLRHPNIISLMGGFIHESGRPSIVFEYASNGSMDDILRNHDILLDFDKKFSFIHQIAHALHYIHSFDPPIIHRDLKPANILLTNDWTIKLADFGLARKCDSTLTCGQGTIKWMAPEVLSNQNYSIKADIYSFALLVWEIFERKPFFEEFKSNSQIEIQVVNYNARPKFSESFPKKLGDLVIRCWDQDPDNRPTTSKILNELNLLSEVN